MEWFDVVDESDRVVGRELRAVVHARGLRHRATHVWLLNPRHELFVQQRSLDKDSAPGCYDSSASGHLDCGESYDDCAARELWEELGIRVAPTQLERLFKLPAGPDTGREFVWIYRLVSEQQPTPNPSEIMGGAFMSRAEVETLVRTRPETCARSFCRIVREMLQRGLWR